MLVGGTLDAKTKILDERILAFIASGGASEGFERLALDLFAYQRARNAIYGAYCDEVLAGRGEPGGWRELPGLWPVAWRMTKVVSFDPATAVAEFRSSGTTAAERSRHLFDTLDLYRAALAGPFAEAFGLPLPGGEGRGEGAGQRAQYSSPSPPPPLPAWRGERRPILVLMPSPEEAGDSSLSFMVGEAMARFGRAESSGFFVRDGQFLMREFADAVRRSAGDGRPVVLASTAFGWVALLEWLAGRELPLPPGSRIMETGGYKGRTRAWPREELYACLARAFAVRLDAIVSEYGMCELSSQFYAGQSAVSNQQSAPVFKGPPWTRVLAIDPETQRPVTPGEPGLLRIIDLANRGSTIVVQTEDVAIARGEREFELIGRAPSAPAKGCSLTAEDLGRMPAK